MTTGVGSYVVPLPTDTDPSPAVLETTIVAGHGMVNIGGGTMAHAETFNGAIPGPILRLNVGDTVIVRLVNEMDHPTGIHWHGIELPNSSDGTEVTQAGAQPSGGTYLYKFKARRPGLYWYHPHHNHATNRVFRGMYGMIAVADPNEASLIAAGVLPGAADTQQVVLSDITVCRAPGSNDAATYVDPTTLPVADRAEWLSGATSQPAPAPIGLCELPTATDEHGLTAAAPYGAMDVPSMVRTGRLNEGQTVLTNGMNVGGRLGTPAAPGPLAPGAQTLPVKSGQGLRIQFANCATTRYFRLRLTTSTGVQVPLVRVGGEGGLLDNAVVEGGALSGFGTYDEGEILLPSGSRADVVAAVPPGITGVLTLWTRDYERGGAMSALPTVPVMHLNVTGAAATTYTISGGTPLRASIPGAAVQTLGAPTAVLLEPGLFLPPRPGMSDQDIQLTGTSGINGISGNFDGFTPYSTAPHIDSSRWATPGSLLELTATNNSSGHHPFHLHGFSFQPVALTQLGLPTYTWPYREFRDNIDIPPGYTLSFRVRLDDRELKDGVTLGGALGRWLFHCHIFMHHHMGMMSELVVAAGDGGEKPHVDVNGSWAYTPVGGIAHRQGTYWSSAGAAVTLGATTGIVTDNGAGNWSWSYDSTGMPAHTEYVYISATDPAGRRDQAVFRLKVGGPDDGSDNGDPHVHTVDGTSYDFQAAGEFILLRDREGMEIQVRQWPVQTANPVTDAHTGLTSCVSVNVAVAARVGAHRIAYQPGKDGLEFYVDGDRVELPRKGLDLGEHRVTADALAGGATALRLDYASQTVVTITPYFWNSYNIWLLNVSVWRTQADEGIMGRIPPDSWLPALPTTASLGPKPSSLNDRFITLYRTFADAWRVTEASSLFVYEPGTSTRTFTDRNWPAEKPPCALRKQFRIPGAQPSTSVIALERARKICQGVTIDALHRDCVYDVAATGDEDLANAYLIQQDLALRSSAVQVVASEPRNQPGDSLVITATVLPLIWDGPRPTGSVTFLIDDEPVGKPVAMDKRGRASFIAVRLKPGDHRIRATYGGGGQREHLACSSPTLVHSIGEIDGRSSPILRPPPLGGHV